MEFACSSRSVMMLHCGELTSRPGDILWPKVAVQYLLMLPARRLNDDVPAGATLSSRVELLPLCSSWLAGFFFWDATGKCRPSGAARAYARARES